MRFAIFHLVVSVVLVVLVALAMVGVEHLASTPRPHWVFEGIHPCGTFNLGPYQCIHEFRWVK